MDSILKERVSIDKGQSIPYVDGKPIFIDTECGTMIGTYLMCKQNDDEVK